MEKTFGYRTRKQAQAIAQSLRRNSAGRVTVRRSGREVTVKGNVFAVGKAVHAAELRVRWLHEYEK